MKKIFIFLGICLVAFNAPGTVKRGTNPPAGLRKGTKPYEMIGRKELRKPFITFEDCTKWQTIGSGVGASLSRSSEKRLFRDYCGKLSFRFLGGKSSSVFVKLISPLTIPGDWDCINFWNWGNSWIWERSKSNPVVRLSLLIKGADDKIYDIKLGHTAYEYWFLSHKKINQKIPRPAKFVGLKISNCGNTKAQQMYLGPIYFYKEKIKKTDLSFWPQKLPFPTRANTILPENKIRKYKNTTLFSKKETKFIYSAKDCKLTYYYRPASGTLSDISIYYKRNRIYPCRTGGICINGINPSDPAVKKQMLQQYQSPKDPKLLIARWKYSNKGKSAVVDWRIKIIQKSLIIDFIEIKPAEEGSAISKLYLGYAAPVTKPQLFRIPGLAYGFGGRRTDPQILYSNGLFFFNQFDWYFSDASKFYSKAWIDKNKAFYNGGAEYLTKTDGNRNFLKERLFINVSPDVQEVFPTIPNPPSTMRLVQGDRQWRIKCGAPIDKEIEEARHLRKLGLEKVTIRYHEPIWRDAGESYTFRANAAPGRGGDAALKKLVNEVRKTGWLVGLYTNYMDIPPVNKYWDENCITRTESGDWRHAWTRCYAPNPMWALKMQRKLASEIKKKYNSNHSYCDVHTSKPPFERVDYNALNPGAGTFRRTFESFGLLLLNEKKVYKGPVFSEGEHRWWYAGLSDGNYGQITGYFPYREPLFVDFDLLKIHPLEMDAGMGCLGMFFKGGAKRNLQQFIATTLAYGHIGLLEGSEEYMMKMYYMLQPLQRYYSMIPVKKITYEHNGKMVDTSKALISGAYKKARLYVEYVNGFRIWINGSEKSWKFKEYELPQWGFLAKKGDKTFCYSGLVDIAGFGSNTGDKVYLDISHGLQSHYFNSGNNQFVRTKQLAGIGAAAIKKEKNVWEIIPARKFKIIGFDPALLGLRAGKFEIKAVDKNNTLLSPPEIRLSRNLCYIIPHSQKAFKYLIKKSIHRYEPGIKCKKYFVKSLEDVKIILPSNCSPQQGIFYWFSNNCRAKANIMLKNGAIFVKVPQNITDKQQIWLEFKTKSGRKHYIDFIVKF